MFDTVLSNKSLDTYKTEPHFDALKFKYTKRGLLLWEEHCVECSPPFCYGNCENYLARVDKKCVRLVNGIRRTKEHYGSLGYGADCEFRKWAKLESIFYNRTISDKRERFVSKISTIAGKLSLVIARSVRWIWPTLKPYGAYVALRNRYLSKQGHKETDGPELFYIRCLLKEKDNVQLLVQIDGKRIYYSKVHQLRRGENEIAIPLNGILNSILRARVFVSPLEESNTNIIFSWIDFFYGVSYSTIPAQEQPAEKVKVVAWDLDNTLWDGVLIEDKKVQLRRDAVDVIKKLDERGILNTIVSKNDFDEAYDKLKQFGLAEYFVSPAINWGSKSLNLKNVAENLNLGLNSFAFIDDNIRERAEVSEALPMVRVFSELEIKDLLDKSEFDVIVTEDSKNRRKTYQQEAERKVMQATFNDDYDAFLRGLGMKLLVENIDGNNKIRCYELLQRSNQLNLSTHRYSMEEYESLIADKDTICKAFRVSDRFGDYGIVSFMSVKIHKDEAEIIDFVISCRVAKKKVEQAIIIAIKDILIQKGINTLKAVFIKTKKNGPLASVFEELPFKKEGEDNSMISYRLYNMADVVDAGIIQII